MGNGRCDVVGGGVGARVGGRQVKVRKPKASRDRSPEIYLVGLDFRR
jgi:hypothetical protein